jgi:hypothetical protein
MLVLKANDHVTDGSLELYHSDNSGSVSPFGFTFTRYSCGKYPPSTHGFSMSKWQAKKLAKFIIENL